MPTFLDLPVEVQLQIFSEVDLDDIEQFTLCCKATHRHSEERLAEQYARKRSFHTIAIGHIDNHTWDEDKQVRGVHPLLVLRDIVADPQSRYYTKTLIIGPIERNGLTSNNTSIDDQEEAELDESDIRDAATQLKTNLQPLVTALGISQFFAPIYKQNDTETRIEEILSGEIFEVARFLMPMFPNLQKLRLMDRYKDYDCSPFSIAIDAILRKALMQDRTGIKTFSKLTEVGMICTYQDYGATFEYLGDFMCFPSMKSIRGQASDGGEIADYRRTSCVSSKVTNIEFRQSSITAAFFKHALRATTGLQSFIYDFRPSPFGEKELWEPRKTVEALKAHTKKTLSNLELTALTLPYEEIPLPMLAYIDFRHGEPFVGSLNTFEVLATIRLETMMLYKEVEGAIRGTHEPDITYWPEGADVLVQPERLVDILPMSARRLRLVGGLCREDATAMLEDLHVLKDQRLPNLSRIFFEDIERSDVDEMVIKECEDAGIKMKFWQPQAK